jgi:hypothetical protein
LEKSQEETPAPEEQPKKRRRGRPRKNAPLEELEKLDKEQRVAPLDTDEPVLQQPSQDMLVEGDDGEVEAIAEVDEGDDGFVHIDTFAGSATSENELAQADDAPLNYEQYSERPPAQATSDFMQPFDFTSLTPLHVNHPLQQPQQAQTPTPRDPKGRYIATEFYTDVWRSKFSPLPPRASPGRSPIPFSRRQSSPATEQDASMWRDMVARQHGGISKRAGASAEPESHAEDDDDFEAESEVDMPEATSRTLGDATMMQSEDFSMVSLSSLPSAKDINSSLSERGGIEQSHSHIERSTASPRQPSKLNKEVTFSSPLVQSIHSQNGRRSEEVEGSDEEAHELPSPRKWTPQKSSQQLTQHSNQTRVYPLPRYEEKGSLLIHTPKHLPSTNNASVRVPHSHSHQRTPVTEPGRLPTPNSGENQTSPPQRSNHLQADISYPEVDNSPYSDIQDTPAKSEAEMSTPPATPERDESLALKPRREPSLMASGSRRSLADEPKSPRMIVLEKKWQEERENVKRALADAKRPVIHIESDPESSSEEMEDVDEIAPAPAPAPVPIEDQTADIWQDISASYDEDGSQIPRKQHRGHTRLAQPERPSKVARTRSRRSPTEQRVIKQEPAATPNKSFATEENMTSVQRRAKTKADISALFDRLGNGSGIESFQLRTHQSPARPSPLRHAYIETDPSETDLSALSDVRQLRNEMRHAQRRPPFALAARGTTTSIPTKIKSVDDTLTTTQEDEGAEEHVSNTYDRSSFISFTGQRHSSRSLFGDSDAETSVKSEKYAVGASQVSATLTRPTATTSISSSGGLFSFIWNTLTFSQPYIPPVRPTHPSLADAIKFPMLPCVWPWSRTHWQTLDNLYQYYKRKPSRFSPSRKARPDNTGLMTPSWSRYVDITFDHWGYRIRLEDTHIVLAILFMQLLILPSQNEYKKLYGKGLEWGHQDPNARVGEKISKWEVLKHVFAIVAGELLREDEERGLRIRRELEEFRYRLAEDEGWQNVDDPPKIV